MEIKKTKKADLETKRALIFQLGLLVTGSLTLAAFTYQNPNALADMQAKVDTRPSDIDYVLMQKPKEQQQQQQKTEVDTQSSSSTVNAEQQASEQMKAVGNSKTNPQSQAGVDLGSLKPGGLKVGGGIIDIPLEDKIEDFPEVEAKFPGGPAALQRFIQENLNYPDESMLWGDEGLVAITFVIEKDGTVTNVAINQGVSKELDREARRLVKSFPKWIPGESRYEKVRSRVLLPIRFEIGK